MRATRRRWLTGLALGVWVLLLVIVAVVSADDHGRGDGSSSTPASERFVEAWRRSREGAYVTVGTFGRHSPVTGASISSPDILAQDPPRRLHRQLGSVEGRDDDRLLSCPAGTEDEQLSCSLGPPGGPSYQDDVTQEVAALRTLVAGSDPVYRVADGGPGCFRLVQQRVAPGASFGVRSRYCFDEETGAMRSARVTYPGGIEETLAVRDIRSQVQPADLEP